MSEPTEQERRRPFLLNPFLWVFLVGAVFLTVLRFSGWLVFEPDPPPPIAEVPPFDLVDARGRVFGSRDLAGSTYVAGFFFTSCRSICPAMMIRLRALQDRYEAEGVDGVRMISISVDPEVDTPATLAAYGERLGVKPRRWTLLTGDLATVTEVVDRGFRAGIGERRDLGDGLYDIAHSEKVVLVDPEGRIRGYYRTDDEGLDEVFHRSQHVRNAYE